MQNEKVIHISELGLTKKGQQCNCRCVECGKPMVAKMGNINAWHFAHLHNENNNNCNAKTANESGLHKLAKQIIKDSNTITLPPFSINGTEDPNCNINDQKQVEAYKCNEKYTFNYSEVDVEVAQSNYIPDLCLSNASGKLFVEIAVTHFVDKEKRQKIKKNNVSTIEIDLSEFYLYPKSVNDLKIMLLNRLDCKKWIYNKRESEYHAKFFPQLQKRNKKLELQFQEEKRRKDKEETDRKNCIEARKLLKKQIESNCIEAYQDRQLHATIIKRLHNNKKAEEHFRNTTFYEQTKDKGIPSFCNIPVRGEIAFNCDRRIWQMELFDRFFYNNNENFLTFVDMFEYFYENWKDKLNDDFVYKKDKKEYYRAEGKYYGTHPYYGALGEAITDYLKRLKSFNLIKSDISDISYSTTKKYYIYKNKLP